MTTEYTTNRQYPKPDFDTRTWHDQMHQSLDMIDEDIGTRLFSAPGFVTELWDHSVAYAVNDKVLDADKLQLFICNVGHTSVASGTFQSDRIANPSYWTAFGTPLVPRGAWAHGTSYAVLDHVYDQTQGISAVCSLAHTSNGAGTIRDDVSKWLFIVDLQAIMASGQITVPFTDVAFSVVSTDGGAVIGPALQLYRNSPTPAVSDVLGAVRFAGNNAGLFLVRYGSVYATLLDPVTENGQIAVSTRVDGVSADKLIVARGLWTPNALGGDQGIDTINVRALYEDGVSVRQRYSGGPRNLIRRNGGFDVWQRGTALSVPASTTVYTADGWYLATGANQACTVTQVVGIGAAKDFAAKVQRNSGQTGVAVQAFGFPLDSFELAPMRGRYVRVSAVLKAGANWSPASGQLQMIVVVGTGTPIKLVLGYTGQVVLISSGISLTTTPTRYEFGAAILAGSGINQAEVGFQWTPTGTAGADDSFTVDDVQLEVVETLGQLASPFEQYNFSELLPQCQRHYYKTFQYGTVPIGNAGTDTGELFAMAGQAGAGLDFIFVRFPVHLRLNPFSVATYNPSAVNTQIRNYSVTQDCSATVATLLATGGKITCTGSAGTLPGHLLGVHLTASAGI